VIYVCIYVIGLVNGLSGPVNTSSSFSFLPVSSRARAQLPLCPRPPPARDPAPPPPADFAPATAARPCRRARLTALLLRGCAAVISPARSALTSFVHVVAGAPPPPPDSCRRTSGRLRRCPCSPLRPAPPSTPPPPLLGFTAAAEFAAAVARFRYHYRCGSLLDVSRPPPSPIIAAVPSSPSPAELRLVAAVAAGLR
jgi:hypothetical protein